MMKRKDNEDLCRVGPGTPMGDMFRAYWHPVLRSDRLVADGEPARVRLLGEDFVAYRATDGRVGFVNEACPHRCASMAMARNEENGLRCIFHGWKIDVSGALVDIPILPPDEAARMMKRIKVQAYPVCEAGGLIWVYPNADKAPPAFPDFEFTHLHDDQVDTRIAIIHCNWLQVMEGLLDSAHLGFLHASSGMKHIKRIDSAIPKPVTVELEETDYGLREAAIREMADGRRHVRIREIVAPHHTVIVDSLEHGGSLFDGIAVPIDDEHTAQLWVSYNPHRALIETDLEILWRYGSPDRHNIYAGRVGPEAHWGQNRAAMKQGNWSGAPNVGTPIEDFMVQESQGPIADRTQEHLVATDRIIAAVRAKLLTSARAFVKGAPAWGLARDGEVDYAAIRPAEIVVPPDRDWRTFDPFADDATDATTESLARAG